MLTLHMQTHQQSEYRCQTDKLNDMNAINATKETHQLSDTLNNYANYCNTIQTQVNAQDMKYYMRDVVDCALLIAFFFTAADNANAYAKRLFDSSYLLNDYRTQYNYIEIDYANGTIQVPGVN
jgi:hypothetical protein